MSESELSEREKFVLGSIVESFVQSATPVGSSYLANKSKIELSPATIRNVMMDLERKGYLLQPHTSAGRMPTNKGYRFYVDSLMRVEKLSEDEIGKIFENFRTVSRDIEFVLEAASLSLASISRLLGVVLAPRFYQGVLEKIDLVPIADKKVLVVITIKSGLVRTITMELDNEVSNAMLEETARILNERLHGLTLQEIKRTIDERMVDAGGSHSFIDLVLKSSNMLFSFPAPSDIHFGGTTNIMVQPEFSDKISLGNIMGLLDAKEILIHVFNQDEDEFGKEGSTGKIRITIGEENKDELIRHCSLVTATYHLGNVTGTLGVIGPTRMQYSKLITLVDYMAKALSDVLRPLAT